jgi:hypothetical protein
VTGSTSEIETNPDAGVPLWLEPNAPTGYEQDWVQTIPGRGYNVLLRLYGPLDSWFAQGERSFRTLKAAPRAMVPHSGRSSRRRTMPFILHGEGPAGDLDDAVPLTWHAVSSKVA